MQTTMMIKSNLETMIESFTKHNENEHQLNLSILADILENDELIDEEDDLAEISTILFLEFLYQTSSIHFSVDWKDVEAMQDHLEDMMYHFSIFLPSDFKLNWDELSHDEDDLSIPLILNVARQQLLVYGLEVLIFDDGCDIYRGWITPVKYVDHVLSAAENLNLDLSVPDDKWLEAQE